MTSGIVIEITKLRPKIHENILTCFTKISSYASPTKRNRSITVPKPKSTHAGDLHAPSRTSAQHEGMKKIQLDKTVEVTLFWQA
jgi:hypothetical protein